MPGAPTLVSSRRADWERLEALLRRAGAGNLHQLSASELEELGQLYRRLTSDLAVAQRDFPEDRLTAYLNHLLARTHAQIYRPEASGWRRLGEFFRCDFPSLYRRSSSFVLISLCAFAIPGLLAYVLAIADPLLGESLVAPQLVDFLRRGELWTDVPEPLQPFFSSLIMANNIQVAFFAFAAGVLAGVGTIYVLAANGLMLGSVFGVAQNYGMAAPLLNFVAAHAVIELSVVVIAGAAGLKLGWSILRPGLLARRDSLSLAGRESVQLILGCVPLLVIAAVLEGFVSPSALPPPAKYAISASTGVLLYIYLLLGGRAGLRASREPVWRTLRLTQVRAQDVT